MIQFEKEIIAALALPSIPVKEWDGKSDFKDGVAVVSLYGDRHAYAIATFDSAADKQPRIKRVFGVEPFGKIERIFVVPSYMETDVKDADLDDESKKRAEILAKEAEEIENEGTEMKVSEEFKDEYVFDDIHNDAEGIAFIKAYNSRNKVKGRIPETHEAIVMRLIAIKAEIDAANK